MEEHGKGGLTRLKPWPNILRKALFESLSSEYSGDYSQ